MEKAEKFERKCTECTRSISACMGFVVAGDFLKFISGKIPREKILEYCGVCIFKKETELELLLQS
jgi:hypothetical protein